MRRRKERDDKGESFSLLEKCPMKKRENTHEKYRERLFR
jgi:hypothetical protein